MRPAIIAAAGTLILVVSACSDSSSSPTQDSTGGTSASPSTRSAAATSGDPCFDEGKDFEGEARVYIEHNATDQDTGFHGMFDQEGLAKGCIRTPGGTQIMLVEPTKQLAALGINQFFFESREPPNDEYSIADLKADFPEGEYRISGFDYTGVKRVGAATFTHAIPAAPKIVAPKVVPEEKAESNTLP
ncbi:MAG: hypothetical protein ACRDV2_16565, partial [Actinomycetes bacterium]